MRLRPLAILCLGFFILAPSMLAAQSTSVALSNNPCLEIEKAKATAGNRPGEAEALERLAHLQIGCAMANNINREGALVFTNPTLCKMFTDAGDAFSAAAASQSSRAPVPGLTAAAASRVGRFNALADWTAAMNAYAQGQFSCLNVGAADQVIEDRSGRAMTNIVTLSRQVAEDFNPR
jgi:hypothetical protein